MKHCIRLCALAMSLGFCLLVSSPAQADTCTVTTDADSGAGSLREQLGDVSCGTIVFDDDYTITLTGELAIGRDVTIDGEGHNVTISGNHATRVFNVTTGDVTFKDLTIADGNVTTYDCGGLSAICGGGIMMQNSAVVVTLQGSTLSGNSAYHYGGGIYSIGTLNVVSSTVSGNSATYNWAVQCPNYGGGLYNESGTANVTNSTFSRNDSDCGGAIFNEWGATLNITNSTISENSSAYGSGLMNWGPAAITVTNSILWGAAGGGGDIVNWAWATSSLTVNYSVVGSAYAYNGLPAYSGTGNQTGDPLLSPPGDHGGSNQTYALLPGSPAIDAGAPTGCPAVDQRGEARDDLRCDMGAYELEYADSPTVNRSVASGSMTTFGPALIGIQRNGGVDPGVITATKMLSWQTKPANAIDAYWAITPTVDSGLGLTLMLCYTPAESNNLELDALRFWKSDGSEWSAAPGTPITSTVGANSCASLAGIDELSVWTLAPDSPTAVTLQSYTAHPSDGATWPAFAVLIVVVFGIAMAWRHRKAQV